MPVVMATTSHAHLRPQVPVVCNSYLKHPIARWQGCLDEVPLKDPHPARHRRRNYFRYLWTKSAKGTAEEPGRNVKQKSGLNREILNTGWGQLERNLNYKAGRVVKVDSAYTSQTCSVCGHTYRRIA